MKDVAWYKYGKKGHISKYCRVSKKLQELSLGNEVLEKLLALLIETFEFKTNSKDSSDKGYPQIDEI